jgi:gliding motility-associated lipoprotein GldD
MRLLLFLLCIGIFISCNDDVVIKPSALLRLDYPLPEYMEIDINCPFAFEKNSVASIIQKQNCAFNIRYSKMNATIYLTYQAVMNNNIDSLLYDAQKLAYNHDIKALSIPEQPFYNPDKNVYGMFYMINGDAASQSHFYVTDSLNHFLTGSLYFESKPNFDSIYPAVVFLREDIRRMMETMHWKSE